jgi:hypothetical protein
MSTLPSRLKKCELRGPRDGLFVAGGDGRVATWGST